MLLKLSICVSLMFTLSSRRLFSSQNTDLLGYLLLSADLTSHTGMKYAPDVGSSLSKNVEVHRMQKQADHYLGAMDSDPRYNLNCTSRLGVYPISEWNSSLEVIKYDAIQRQLEKQQIREEIIASEIMRRRILETEVRRELEQEMALRRAAYGFRSQERFPFLFDQRFSFVDRLNNELMLEPQALGGDSTVNLFSLRYPLQPFSEATQPGINSEASGSREIIQVRLQILISPLFECPLLLVFQKLFMVIILF